MKKRLARIKAVNLRLIDGMLFLEIDLDFGCGETQKFIGLRLDRYSEEKRMSVGTAAGLDYIMKIMRTFNVSSLNRLVMKGCNVIFDDLNTIIGLEEVSYFGSGRSLVLNQYDSWF